MNNKYPFMYKKAASKYLVMLIVPPLTTTLLLGGLSFFYSAMPVIISLVVLTAALLVSLVLIEVDLGSCARSLAVSRREVFLAKFGLEWSYNKIEGFREKFNDEFYSALRKKETEVSGGLGDS